MKAFRFLENLPDQALFHLYDETRKSLEYFNHTQQQRKAATAKGELEEIEAEISRRDTALFEQDCQSGEAW